jgi:hypothetical protein
MLECQELAVIVLGMFIHLFGLAFQNNMVAVLVCGSKLDVFVQLFELPRLGI